MGRIASGGTPSGEESKTFVQVAEKIEKRMRKSQPYKKLTIHAYRPRNDLSGLLGLLDFRRDRMENLVQQGFTNAAEHDCASSGCLLPN